MTRNHKTLSSRERIAKEYLTSRCYKVLTSAYPGQGAMVKVISFDATIVPVAGSNRRT